MAADFKVRGEVDVDAQHANQGLDGLKNLIKNLGLAALFAEGVKGAVELGKAIVQVGSDFESSMAKTKTLFTGTTEEFAQLQKDILATSTATGQSAKTLAEAAYSAESAGVAQEDLAAMIDHSSKLAVAGFTDVDTALSATAKTMNAYGMTGEDSIDRVQRVLMQTQNLGITTVDELGQSLAHVTPTAAAFGVTFEEVGASLAGMTAQGTSTAQATTQLNALISELGKNGTVASKNLAAAAEGSKYAGMSFSEMKANGATLNEILDMMSDYADANGVSLMDMFGSIEAGKAALSIDSSDFVANLEAMATEADVVGEAYDTIAATFEFQADRVKTAAENMGIAIYQSMQGTLAEMASYAADTLDTLIQAYQEQGLAGLLGAILNIIVNGIPQLIQGLTDLIMKGVEYLKTGGANSMFDSGFELFGKLVQGIISTLPQLLGAIAQLIGQAVAQLIAHLPQFLAAGVQLIGGLVVGILSTAWQVISGLGNIAADGISAVLGWVGNFISGGARLISGLASGIASGAWTIISNIWSVLSNAWSTVTSYDFSGAGWNIVAGIANGIWGAAGMIWNALSSVVSSAWHGVLGWLGIRSPSRRARDEIGHNVMAGMALGFQDDTSAEAAITQQAQDIVAAAQAELDQSKWRLGNVLVDTNAQTEQRLNASWTGESTTILELDGYELARASAPYIDTQMAFEGV